ncbi:TonB-dependent receptor [Sphingorhabdus sp. Alg239-R122]|uniref:TonB-dependent receptor plug domain-containing protein n=1 Tax=Sphingorhabdus sp. Alg239-R122 TaxID=2305989 RepID=UPI0013DC7C74|nr:TonB-dependent receptor [Sphingorhabdus sp. Alg239-R122]
MIKFQKILLHSTMLVPIAVAATATPIHAQDVAQEEQSTSSQQNDGLIVVTGSRIEKRAEESSVPLQVFTSDDIEESGKTDLAEIVTQLPGVGDGISVQNSNNSIQNNGLSTVSLRRLGDNRTLVLINGKRAVSNSGNGDRVSLGTIPAGFVKRAEITTGGASAIYGSDAIAGVANFILEDDFEGVDLDVRFSAPEASGGEELRLEGLYGTRFADDRGYVLLGASYRDEKEIRIDSSRPLAILPVEFDDPADSSRDSFANEVNAPGCDPNNTNRHCILPSFDSDLPGGVFEGDAWFRDGRWFNDKSLRPTLPDGSFDRALNQDFLGDFDGYNDRIGQSLRSKREVLNLGFHGTFEFSDALTASLTALYSDVDTLNHNGLEDGGSGETFGILDGVPDVFEVRRMSSSHPFIPPEVEETRSGTVSWIRSFPELGEEQRINSRETIRVMADFDGQLTDAIRWNAFATYGEWKQRAINNGEINLQNLDFALNIEDDGNGGFQCVDAAARANGCVPINLFGEGSVTAQAADYISYTGDASQKRDQLTAGASINGDLFSLGERDIKFALGLEYRREGQETRGDRDGDLIGGVDGDPTTNDVFVTTHSTFPSLKANYDVIEGFAEIDVPVIVDRLNVSAAARIANYSTIGTIFSFNAGAVWQMNDALRLRTQYSRSQRAPTITEFFSPPRPDADDLQDPCEGLNPDGTGIVAPSSPGGENANLTNIATNCLAEPGIQAFFADPDNAGDPFDGPGGTQGPNAGNQNLKEETAETFTAGFVLTPSVIPNFSLVADYYRIDIKDAIGSVSTQDTVDLCYAADDFPNNKFCDVITRSRTDGSVDQVINFQENLNNELVEGIDATLRWSRIELPVIPGQFDIDFRYSHYFKQQTEFVGLGGVSIITSPLGEIENGKDELRFRAGYRNGGFRLTYTLNFEAGGVDSNDAADPSDDRYFRVGNETYHDIYARYRFGSDARFTITAGINNIFDNYGPIIPSGTDTGSSRNIVSDLNDAVGREFFVGASIRF